MRYALLPAVLPLGLAAATVRGDVQSAPVHAQLRSQDFALSFIGEPPEPWTLLLENDSEAWFYLRQWAGPVDRLSPRRSRSPFVVFDKRSRRWRAVGISDYAFAGVLVDTLSFVRVTAQLSTAAPDPRQDGSGLLGIADIYMTPPELQQ